MSITVTVGLTAIAVALLRRVPACEATSAVRATLVIAAVLAIAFGGCLRGELRDGRRIAEADRVIRAHAGAFDACYAQAQHRHPQLEAHATYRFEIGPDGRFTGAHSDIVSIERIELDACIVAELHRLQVPTTGATTRVQYRFGPPARALARL